MTDKCFVCHSVDTVLTPILPINFKYLFNKNDFGKGKSACMRCYVEIEMVLEVYNRSNVINNRKVLPKTCIICKEKKPYIVDVTKSLITKECFLDKINYCIDIPLKQIQTVCTKCITLADFWYDLKTTYEKNSLSELGGKMKRNSKNGTWSFEKDPKRGKIEELTIKAPANKPNTWTNGNNNVDLLELKRFAKKRRRIEIVDVSGNESTRAMVKPACAVLNKRKVTDDIKSDKKLYSKICVVNLNVCSNVSKTSKTTTSTTTIDNKYKSAHFSNKLMPTVSSHQTSNQCVLRNRSNYQHFDESLWKCHVLLTRYDEGVANRPTPSTKSKIQKKKIKKKKHVRKRPKSYYTDTNYVTNIKKKNEQIDTNNDYRFNLRRRMSEEHMEHVLEQLDLEYVQSEIDRTEQQQHIIGDDKMCLIDSDLIESAANQNHSNNQNDIIVVIHDLDEHDTNECNNRAVEVNSVSTNLSDGDETDYEFELNNSSSNTNISNENEHFDDDLIDKSVVNSQNLINTISNCVTI